jgi:quercetin dioxygenase-like cupin family protein
VRSKVDFLDVSAIRQHISSADCYPFRTFMTTSFTAEELLARFIPASGLKYSTDAFIDYRIPGCGPKKNYALIGPGVSQNPNQPVSLREKHGFQVGGVAMGPGVINPPHMHFTAEVFICTRGSFSLHWGFNPERLEYKLAEGDIASIPTWIYRGFQSHGTADGSEGFMFTGLGQDDTGGILWGAATLEAAREQGVHLTEDYKIIDEHLGGKWEESFQRLQPMTPQEVSQLRTWAPEQMRQRVVKFAELDWSSRALLDSALPSGGGKIAPVIGLGMSAERNHLAPIMNSHGFSVEWLKIPAGGSVSCHRLAAKQVLAIYQGSVEIFIKNEHFPRVPSANVAIKIVANGTMQGNDSYAMPSDVWRAYRNIGSTEAFILVMTPGDERKRITWAPEVTEAAAQAGWGIDANGYVGLKRYIDRSQR